MSYALVHEFHTAFELPILASPGFPGDARRQLRIKLFEEELAETVLAAFARDEVEIADGLGDMVYILWGTALEYGLGPTLFLPSLSSVGWSLLDAQRTWMRMRDAERADDFNEVVRHLGTLLAITKGIANGHGFPLERIVEVIHASNMSKLVAGKPMINDGVLRPDLPVGKVIKGPDYYPPTEHIRALLMMEPT